MKAFGACIQALGHSRAGIENEFIRGAEFADFRTRFLFSLVMRFSLWAHGYGLILDLGNQVKFRTILEVRGHVFRDKGEHQGERWQGVEENSFPMASAGDWAARRLHGIGRPLGLGTFVHA